MKRIGKWVLLAGILAVALSVTIGQGPPITVPFATTPSIKAIAPPGATLLFRKIDASYTQLTYHIASPYLLLSTAAQLADLLSGGLANLLKGPKGPPKIGLASQHGAMGVFTSSGAPGGAFCPVSSSNIYVFLGSPSLLYTGVVLYPVGTECEGVIAADFNGDSVLDLAVPVGGITGKPGGLAIMLNKGDGTFATPVMYPAGNSPVSVAAFDLNNDGILDLVVADGPGSATPQGVFVLFGKSNGTFISGGNYPVNGAPLSVTIADLNHDSKPDLALSALDGTVSILLGSGNGAFQAGSSFPTGSFPTYIAAGDFNGDGHIDLVTANTIDQTVSIFLGAGNGTFQFKSMYATSYYPTNLILTDYNGDGKLDILNGVGDARVLGPSIDSGTIDYLLGNGDGTFQAPPLYTIGRNAAMIAVGDLNGDGKPDLVTPNITDNSLTILLGQGNGQFQIAPTYNIPNSGSSSANPVAVAAADLNGDGHSDLAVVEGSNQVAVILGKGDGTFQPLLNAPVGKEPRSIVIGDFNADQKPDLAVANAGNTSSQSGDPGSVSILIASGGGAFKPATTLQPGLHPLFIASADINGDGKPDLVTANNGMFQVDPGGVSIFLSNGDGTFQTAKNFAAGPRPTTLTIGDVNGDGKLDLVVAMGGTLETNFNFFLAVLLGNGDGTFQAPKNVPTDFGPASIIIKDFSGDGKADLVVAHCCGNTDMTYLIGNGNGTFQSEMHFNGGSSPSFIATDDFNHDGKTDLAILNQSPDHAGTVTILLNSSTGTGGCAYTLSSTSVQAPLAGASFPITIQAAASCPWTVTGLPSWITVSDASSGSGPGSATLVVAANSGPARSATISIAGVPVTVNQAGKPACSYTISPGGQAFTESGGSGTITVTAPTGCVWSASGPPSWVTISSGSSGSGNGTISYHVQANASGTNRSGTITIASVTFTVEEAAPLPGGLSLGSMAQIASAGGWKTTITLINTGNGPARARLNFFDNNGNPMVLPLTFPQSPLAAGALAASTVDRTLNAGAVLVIESTGPAGDAVLQGSAQLQAGAGVGGYAIFTATATNQEAVVPLETRNASSYLLAFDNTAGVATGLAIANVGTQAVGVKAAAQATNVPVILRNDAGTKIGNQVIPLGSRQHTSFLLAPTYAATAGIRGTVEFDTPAGAQISALGLRADGAALTTLPVLASVSAGGGSMAHVASGGGWKTIFTLVNGDTASSAEATLSFFDENGNPLSLPLTFPQTGSNAATATVTRTLAPGAVLVIEAQGPAAQAVIVGSARLTTTDKVGGFALFRDATTGQEAVVPIETRKANAYILVYDNANGLATGLALANLSAHAVNVPVVLRNDLGGVIGTPVISVPAGGHTSFLLTPTYAVTAGKRGSVEFDTPAGSQITVLGLRATPAGTLTTVPVLVK